MNKNRDIPILAAILALFIIVWCATNALGASALIQLPTLPGDTSNEARAIVPDGKWVAGVSHGSGTYPDRGFLYDVTGGNVYNVAHGAQCTIAAGVCYRTVGSQQEIIVGGLTADWNSDFMTTNGTAFAAVRRDIYGSSGQQPRIGFANQRASGGGDVFWGGWGDIGSAWQFMAVGKVSGAWNGGSPTVANDEAPTGSQVFAVYGVSGTGRAVGYIKSGGYHNFLADWNGSGSTTVTYFAGLDGSTLGFAYSISADGLTVFGNSPSLISIDGLYHGYKQVDPIGTPIINQLPDFPDTTGSTYNLVVPYGCTSDGKYAVGATYRNGLLKAVVWDTSNSDPTQWTVLDLTELAKLEGVLGDFTLNLRWAYSVGTNANGLVIAGSGYDTGVNLRAFLMTVPLPLAPALTISNSGGGFTLSYLGFGNTTNVLEYTTNLNLPHTWTPIDTNTSGYVATVLDPAPPDPQRYYRVRIQ